MAETSVFCCFVGTRSSESTSANCSVCGFDFPLPVLCPSTDLLVLLPLPEILSFIVSSSSPSLPLEISFESVFCPCSNIIPCNCSVLSECFVISFRLSSSRKDSVCFLILLFLVALSLGLEPLLVVASESNSFSLKNTAESIHCNTFVLLECFVVSIRLSSPCKDSVCLFLLLFFDLSFFLEPLLAFSSESGSFSSTKTAESIPSNISVLLECFVVSLCLFSLCKDSMPLLLLFLFFIWPFFLGFARALSSELDICPPTDTTGPTFWN